MHKPPAHSMICYVYQGNLYQQLIKIQWLSHLQAVIAGSALFKLNKLGSLQNIATQPWIFSKADPLMNSPINWTVTKNHLGCRCSEGPEA